MLIKFKLNQNIWQIFYNLKTKLINYSYYSKNCNVQETSKFKIQVFYLQNFKDIKICRDFVYIKILNILYFTFRYRLDMLY